MHFTPLGVSRVSTAAANGGGGGGVFVGVSSVMVSVCVCGEVVLIVSSGVGLFLCACTPAGRPNWARRSNDCVCCASFALLQFGYLFYVCTILLIYLVRVTLHNYIHSNPTYQYKIIVILNQY